MKNLIIIFLMAFVTSVSFSQWIQLQSGTTQSLYDICFINESTGIAVGSNGIILRTTNNGLNWTTIPSSITQSIFSTCFPSITTGYASDYTGYVIKTSNSGSSWFNATGCGINVRSISFINALTGITGGGGNLMCYSTDGGSSWNPRYTPSPHMVSGVHYFNASMLMVCVTDMPGALIYKSTNTGYNWSTVLMLNNSGLNISYTLSYIYFKDDNTGFATGSNYYYGTTWGQIYRSTNSGNNWELVSNIGSAAGNNINAVHFGDNSIGFAAGSNGMILRSTNSGANWVSQTSGTTATLNGIFMINALTGYACGANGLILKTTNGGVTGVEPISNKTPSDFKLYQNYPNPFNPITKIRFDIPKSSFVKIVVYNSLGKEVGVLVSEKLNAGSYEVNWPAPLGDGSGNPSGVYFYRLVTGDFVDVKMMVFLK
ncbi:MAG: T9SS type A sorting domain-containing protein [Ignavibacteria bacterium]|nr:T9SS type A sorting domain-containing protein [Ignavibacteria bacterium]